jgi:hypothetical protein
MSFFFDVYRDSKYRVFFSFTRTSNANKFFFQNHNHLVLGNNLKRKLNVKKIIL